MIGMCLCAFQLRLHTNIYLLIVVVVDVVVVGFFVLLFFRYIICALCTICVNIFLLFSNFRWIFTRVIVVFMRYLGVVVSLLFHLLWFSKCFHTTISHRKIFGRQHTICIYGKAAKEDKNFIALCDRCYAALAHKLHLKIIIEIV